MKQKFNGSLMAIVGEGLFSRLSFGLISFSLPLYARHLGLSLKEVGILAALNSAVSVGAKPMMGWLADRAGLKRTYVAAMCLRSLVSLALGFASMPWELFAIRSAHGLTMSLRDPSANALIAEHGTEKNVGSAFAWYQTAKAVAASLSKAMAGILLTITAANYSLVFFLAFGLSLLPVLVVGRFVKPEAKGRREDGYPDRPAEPAPETRPREIRRPSVLPFTLLGFLIAATAEMLTGLFPVLATEYAGLSKAEAGIVYTIATLAIIVSGPVFGWLSDNVSHKLVLTFRGLANTLSSILYVVDPTFAGVIIAKTADDMGKSAFRPAWGSLMAKVSSYDRRNRARTMSWMSMGEDAGAALSPVLAGFLWNTWGIAVMMGTRVALALITEIYAIVITRIPKAKEVTTTVSLMRSPAARAAVVVPQEVCSEEIGGES